MRVCAARRWTYLAVTLNHVIHLRSLRWLGRYIWMEKKPKIISWRVRLRSFFVPAADHGATRCEKHLHFLFLTSLTQAWYKVMQGKPPPLSADDLDAIEYNVRQLGGSSNFEVANGISGLTALLQGDAPDDALYDTSPGDEIVLAGAMPRLCAAFGSADAGIALLSYAGRCCRCLLCVGYSSSRHG